jgi:hypothetical protein
MQKWQNKGGHDLYRVQIICPLLTYVTIYILVKYGVVVLWEQECHRIFAENLKLKQGDI